MQALKMTSASADFKNGIGTNAHFKTDIGADADFKTDIGADADFKTDIGADAAFKTDIGAYACQTLGASVKIFWLKVVLSKRCFVLANGTFVFDLDWDGFDNDNIIWQFAR